MIYDTDKNNRVRYTLGEMQGRTLFTFGVNPSKASPEKLDATVSNVRSFSKILGFDSFLMLNLYPQRATDPNDMHKRLNREIHQKNIQWIEHYIPKKATCWAAWGNLVVHRPYLKNCLFEIDEVLRAKKVRWIQYDDLTKAGHPKHPSRKKIVNNFKAFDIKDYLNSIE